MSFSKAMLILSKLSFYSSTYLTSVEKGRGICYGQIVKQLFENSKDHGRVQYKIFDMDFIVSDECISLLFPNALPSEITPSSFGLHHRLYTIPIKYKNGRATYF